jgi:hypothetical protein
MTVPPLSSGEIADQLAITAVLYRYCRALDRMDRELALTCWHPGGTDNHAPLYSGSAVGFIDWLWPVHAAMVVTRHVVSNILINLKGDSAGSECYWTLTLRILQDGRLFDAQSGGRYLDRFEKIGGMWAIQHRQSIRDWSRVDEVPSVGGHLRLITPNNPEVAETPGRRDRDDFSYSVVGDLKPPGAAR